MPGLSVTLRTLITAVAIATVCVPAAAGAQSGEATFTKTCGACHTIGGGRRVGPDLKGVTERRTEDWLRRFIPSSQTVVQSGDATAKALFDEYKIVMPDQPLSPAELTDLIGYLRTSGSGAATAAAAPAEPPPPASQADIDRGQQIFTGEVRLASRGPACNSCHDVREDTAFGGGVLAKELTTAFGRLGSAGIDGILSSPPFPVMQQAYATHPIADDERVALIAYLQSSSQRTPYSQPRKDGMKLFMTGLGGLTFLMCLYAIAWRQRKTHPVNAKIFERQVHSR